MPKRTYENSAINVSDAADLEILVTDKREHWRASSQKLTKGKGDIKRITKQLLWINNEENGDYSRSIYPYGRVH